MVTEYLPLYHPKTIPGRLRSAIEELWVGIGGIGGWDLGGAPGGWGEGPLISQPDRPKTS